jgi:hypothetical protein
VSMAEEKDSAKTVYEAVSVCTNRCKLCEEADLNIACTEP